MLEFEQSNRTWVVIDLINGDHSPDINDDWLTSFGGNRFSKPFWSHL